jgi:hypothetical protein
MKFNKRKLKRIVAFAGPLMLVSGAALAATSGWGVDAPLTSAGDLLQTSGGYLAGITAIGGAGVGLAVRRDWHDALYGGICGLAGGGLMTNANATLGVVGSSAGVLLHGMQHVATFATLIRHLVS